MKKNTTLFTAAILISILLLSSCTQKSPLPPPSPKSTDVSSSPVATVPGEIVVQLKNPAKGFPKELQKDFLLSSLDQKNGVYLLQGKTILGKEKETILTLEQSGQFQIIEPNFKVYVQANIPRDPKWLELWSLKNYGQDAPGGTEGLVGADIQALEAWKILEERKLPKGNKAVIVAVLDTGIDYSHPDLQNNIWVNAKEKTGTPGIDDDGNGYVDDIYGWNFCSEFTEKTHYGQLGTPDPIDDEGHGTHVSGTIGAVGNNTIGVTGVTWEVSLMALKFLDKMGSGTTADLYRAIQYASKMKVDIINASFGGGAPSKLIEKTIREAGEQGILFVAAAGNSQSNNDNDPAYPASYPIETIISVAATDNRDNLAYFSNYGFQKVHLAAPGVAITSTLPLAIAQAEGREEPYATYSGTSMAAPHVSGAAALVLAADPKLKGNPIELKKRLINAVDWLPNLSSCVASGGRLNLRRAVQGEIGTSPVAQNHWKEEPYFLQTPRYPTELLDQAWFIQKQGAKSIQLHLSFSLIDAAFDAAMLFDQFYRPVMAIPDLATDLWLPPVIGDTAIVKFSNAKVAIQKYLGERQVNDAMLEELFKNDLASLCFKNSNETLWTCLVYDKAGTPFANFNSEGVVIDRIRYLPVDGK